MDRNDCLNQSPTDKEKKLWELNRTQVIDQSARQDSKWGCLRSKFREDFERIFERKNNWGLLYHEGGKLCNRICSLAHTTLLEVRGQVIISRQKNGPKFVNIIKKTIWANKTTTLCTRILTFWAWRFVTVMVNDCSAARKVTLVLLDMIHDHRKLHPHECYFFSFIIEQASISFAILDRLMRPML